MTEWSQEAKDRATERHDIKMEESREAIVDILAVNKTRKQPLMAKKILVAMAAQRVLENRRRGGAKVIPTVGNKEVKPPDARFMRSYWSEICEQAADSGDYIVWEVGRGKGVRLGTLDEYEDRQKTFRAVVNGVVDKHERRADVIRTTGRETPSLSQPILLPSRV